MSEIDFNKLSKKELEQVGRQHGIELDRRLLKSKMVKQLKEHIIKSDCGCGNTNDVSGKCDGSHTAPVYSPQPVILSDQEKADQLGFSLKKYIRYKNNGLL